MRKIEKEIDKTIARLYQSRYAVNDLIQSIDEKLKAGTQGQHGVVLTEEDIRLKTLMDALKKSYGGIYEVEMKLLKAYGEGDLPQLAKAIAKNDYKP